jgi:hypothetical protein
LHGRTWTQYNGEKPALAVVTSGICLGGNDGRLVKYVKVHGGVCV